MRPLLVVTGLWPTDDYPSAGVFVQRRLREVPAVVVGPRSYRGPMPLRYLGILWRAMTARGRFRGVEAHVLFPAGAIGLLAAKIRGLPLVVYAHGADVRVTANENRVYHFLARLVARSADRVVTNSQDMAERLRGLGARDPVVIEPGIDPAFQPTPRPGTRRVLYLGGDRDHKAPEVAEAVGAAMAGPPHGDVPPEAVPSLLARHDVLLVPSHEEPFGLVAAEAIAAGRWVVARDVGGLREIIRDGVNGTLVADNDFAGALARVPDYDPHALAQTVERFALDRHIQRMAALWDDVTRQVPIRR